MNTLLLLSPLALTGVEGAVSAARAFSRGIGFAFGAEGGGVRERDAAVRCSAVYHMSLRRRVSICSKVEDATETEAELTHAGCLIRRS